MPTPVAQGTRAAAGQAVVAFSGEQASASGPTQEAVACSLALRQGSSSDEAQQQGLQVRQQEREIALQRERVQLVRNMAGRYPELVRSGVVSSVEAAEKQTELLDQQARLSEVERARGASQAKLEWALEPLAAWRVAVR